MKNIAKEIRALTIECIASIGQGHIGGSLSIVDALTVLYYKHMNIDPSNPKKEGRDRLVVSKGHAGPGVYATLAHKGYFPKEELSTLNKKVVTENRNINRLLSKGKIKANNPYSQTNEKNTELATLSLFKFLTTAPLTFPQNCVYA
mgnify:CR=1 FL=1